CQHYKNYPYSF
nr:immunoglobulin light chain junction region [Macaca mulatta]